MHQLCTRLNCVTSHYPYHKSVSAPRLPQEFASWGTQSLKGKGRRSLRVCHAVWCIMMYYDISSGSLMSLTYEQTDSWPDILSKKKVPCQIYTIIYNTVTHQKRAWVKEATVHHFWQSIYYASTFTLASLGWGARCSIIFDMLMLMFVLRKGLKLKETFLLAPLVSFRGKNRSFCGSENARWWMMLLGVSRESCFHPNCTLF